MTTGPPVTPFPWLLLPGLLAARNRARRRQAGDTLRALMFSGIGLVVALRKERLRYVTQVVGLPPEAAEAGQEALDRGEILTEGSQAQAEPRSRA